MADSFPPAPKYRYERKFTLNEVDRHWTLNQVKLHPSFFNEIFHPRQINNIYLDTPELKFYKDNIHGIANRKKVRIRWYGSTYGHLTIPKLEYKLKQNLLGDKWTFDLKPFDFDESFDVSSLQKVFESSNLPAPILEDLRILSPTLLNSYKRTYFLSSDQSFRLTFDEALIYYGFEKNRSKFTNKKSHSEHQIVELKYQPEMDKKANNIAKLFPCRLDKSSKYVNGIEATMLR